MGIGKVFGDDLDAEHGYEQRLVRPKLSVTYGFLKEYAEEMFGIEFEIKEKTILLNKKQAV
jgi:hypothetical protein